MGLCPLQGSIEGRRDLAGGRLSSDRRALGNSTSGQCFTSLAFSADGAFLLAGGSTKYVCMYDVEEKVMLRRFQVGLHTHRLGEDCLSPLLSASPIKAHSFFLFLFLFKALKTRQGLGGGGEGSLDSSPAWRSLCLQLTGISLASTTLAGLL